MVDTDGDGGWVNGGQGWRWRMGEWWTWMDGGGGWVNGGHGWRWRMGEWWTWMEMEDG